MSRRANREQRHTPNKRRKSSEAAKKAWGERGGSERWAKDEVDCIVGASCLKEHTYAGVPMTTKRARELEQKRSQGGWSFLGSCPCLI